MHLIIDYGGVPYCGIPQNNRVVLKNLIQISCRLYVAALLGASQEERCQLASITEIMRQCGLQRVDLLKIDVERAELQVL